MKISRHTYDTEDAELLHERSIDVGAREIWLVPNNEITVGWGEPIYGDPGVEYSMATRFLKNLRMMMNSGDEPILVHMKSHGGDWNEGMAIHDAIKMCPCDITILCYTEARSMSSLIFCAADRRVMMPHSWYMVHDGSQAMDGTVKQFLTAAEMSKLTSKQMMDVYVETMRKHSNIWKNRSRAACEKWVREQMDKKEDVYLSPKEAISNGFADYVFDGDWDALVEFDD